jgi:hypothetical protein
VYLSNVIPQSTLKAAHSDAPAAKDVFASSASLRAALARGDVTTAGTVDPTASTVTLVDSSIDPADARPAGDCACAGFGLCSATPAPVDTAGGGVCHAWGLDAAAGGGGGAGSACPCACTGYCSTVDRASAQVAGSQLTHEIELQMYIGQGTNVYTGYGSDIAAALHENFAHVEVSEVAHPGHSPPQNRAERAVLRDTVGPYTSTSPTQVGAAGEYNPKVLTELVHDPEGIILAHDPATGFFKLGPGTYHAYGACDWLAVLFFFGFFFVLFLFFVFVLFFLT